MTTHPTTRVIEHFRRAVLPRAGAGFGDGELLGQFVECRDEVALAALVNRHGSMVWGVCRRLLSYHDAEDAFQATFLVLIRKAATIVPREMVGNWLYGVAHQTALHARRTVARRSVREAQVTEMPDTGVMPQDRWHDLQPLLDEELSRLPDIYRAVIVLCDLEGRSRKAVAHQLGVPEGTVAGRLARARVLLAKRLLRRGVALSVGALATVLAQNVASACVPDSVVSFTIRAASVFAESRAVVAGVISPNVIGLTEGVLKAMSRIKLTTALAVTLGLGLFVTGASVLAYRTAASDFAYRTAAYNNQPPAAEGRVPPSPKQEKKSDKEAFTAWARKRAGCKRVWAFPPARSGRTTTARRRQ
jgi:RNA polymerase sigma factor (sigma-70 family)